MRTWTPAAEIAQLRNLGLAELRTFWAERLGNPRQLASTELTRRWLAWELQALVRGGLDASTRRRLRQVAVALKLLYGIVIIRLDRRCMRSARR